MGNILLAMWLLFSLVVVPVVVIGAMIYSVTQEKPTDVVPVPVPAKNHLNS